MIDLANTLLPNLPEKLTWVYGVLYLFMSLIFLILVILPFVTIFKILVNKRRSHR